MLDKRAVDSRLEQTEDLRGKSGKNIQFVHIYIVFLDKKKGVKWQRRELLS